MAAYIAYEGYNDVHQSHFPEAESRLPYYNHPLKYRGADKSLARPDWKKQMKGRHFSSDAEIIADAETWWDGQHSELFLSGLQKMEVGRHSLFSSWSG